MAQIMRKGRIFYLSAWANCQVSLFNFILYETIESADAGNGNKFGPQSFSVFALILSVINEHHLVQ